MGTSFEQYMNRISEEYHVDTVSTLDNQWSATSFRGYDVVFNVAGIAHISQKKELEPLYYAVNRDLPVAIARKAKDDGVGQFIHMSSMIVYGDMSRVGRDKCVTADTLPQPTTFYGDSKMQADILLDKLQNGSFKVAMIRPPLIYSERALGNFPRLIKIAKTFPMFPNIPNKQSMIYIDNLCEFIRLLIDNNDCGIFCPQNKEYVNTTEMVKLVAGYKGKRIITTRLFNPLLKLLSGRLNIINKAFGNLTYDKSLSEYYGFDYCIVDYEQSIKNICERLPQSGGTRKYG